MAEQQREPADDVAAVLGDGLELPPNVTASVRVPSRAPAEVRDGTGAAPAAVAAFPGAPGTGEAVFEVGSGQHEFSGPALS